MRKPQFKLISDTIGSKLMRKFSGKIKILFVDHTPFIGGGQIWLASHIKHLNKKKFDPFILLAKNSPYNTIYSASSAKIYKISFKKFRVKKSIEEFKKIIRKIKPHVVVATTLRTFVIAALAKNEYKLLFYIMDHSFPYFLLKFLNRKVDKYLTVSRFIRDLYSLDKPKTGVVYLGVDIKKIGKTKLRQVFEFKKSLGIKKGDLVVGFVGRLVSWKGPDVLIEAINKIKNQKIKLIIFGTGQGQKGNIEESIKNKISDLKLENRVGMAGYLKDQELIFKTIDIYVLPSIENEPFSTSLLSAAASGLSIIATRTGGSGEFIKNNINGILIKPGDSSKLSKALLRLVKDRTFAKRLGQRAKEDSFGFSAQNITANLERIYQDYAKD